MKVPKLPKIRRNRKQEALENKGTIAACCVGLITMIVMLNCFIFGSSNLMHCLLDPLGLKVFIQSITSFIFQ